MNPRQLAAVVAAFVTYPGRSFYRAAYSPKSPELKAAQREERLAARLARASRMLARAEAKRARKQAKRLADRWSTERGQMFVDIVGREDPSNWSVA